VRPRWQQRSSLRRTAVWLCHCLLLCAVVLLQEFSVQSLERARGGGIPTGGVLEVVAWQQSDLLSGAGKGAQEGNKPGVGRV
jgi:hypothetical protein